MNFTIPGASDGNDTNMVDASQVDQDLQHISTFPLLLKTNIILTYMDRSELPSEYAAALAISEDNHPFITTWERCLAYIDTETTQRQHYLDTVRAINTAGSIPKPATPFLDAIDTESKRIGMCSQETIYHIRRYVACDWIEEMTEDTVEQPQNHFQRLRDIAYILWVDQKCPREESKMEQLRRAAALRIARDSSVIRMAPLSSEFNGITWIATRSIDRFRKQLFKSINTESTGEGDEKMIIVHDWVRASEIQWADYHVVTGGMPPDAFERVDPLEEFRLQRQREIEELFQERERNLAERRQEVQQMREGQIAEEQQAQERLIEEGRARFNLRDANRQAQQIERRLQMELERAFQGFGI